MIPLFKVYMSPKCVSYYERVVTPQEDGSIYVGQGPVVEKFEQALEVLLESKTRPLTTNSCTSALRLALKCLNIGPGDYVISTPQTCSATNLAIIDSGAKIIWADVDPFTGLIDPQSVASKITSKVKAIMSVDWGGAPCDYDALKSFGLPVIQDGAHTFLTKYKGESVYRNGGDFIALSFQAIKFLTTNGDGGALIVPEEYYKDAKLLRWFGLDRESSASFRCAQDITLPGFKYHMNDVMACGGLANLDTVEERVQRHRLVAKRLCEEIQHPQIYFPPFNRDSSYWIFTLIVLSEHRDQLSEYLAKHGIISSRVHRRNDGYTIFSEFKDESLKGVEYFDSHQLCIPCGWWLSDGDVDHIINVINSW